MWVQQGAGRMGCAPRSRRGGKPSQGTPTAAGILFRTKRDHIWLVRYWWESSYRIYAYGEHSVLGIEMYIPLPIFCCEFGCVFGTRSTQSSMSPLHACLAVTPRFRVYTREQS